MFAAFSHMPDNELKLLAQQGFTAASEENISVLKEGISFLCEQEQQYLSLEHKAYKIRRKILIPTNHEKFSSNYRELLRLIKTKKLKVEQEQALNIYRDKKFWQNLIQSNPDKKNILNSMWRQWSIQGKYANHTTPDLLRIYIKILPLYSSWVTYALLELKSHPKKISMQNYGSYEKYLYYLKDVIEKEKKQIRASFIYRIKLGWAEGDLSYDDLIWASTQYLDLQGVANKTNLPEVTHPIHTMTAKSYFQILQIIENDAYHDEKIIFNNIFLNKDKGFVKVKNHEGKCYFVPSDLSSWVATRRPIYTWLPKWTHWIFVTQKIHYEFFQEPRCQYLLAVNHCFRSDTYNFPSEWSQMISSYAWQTQKKVREMIAGERKRISSTQNLLRKNSHLSLTQMLFGYQNELDKLESKINDKEICFLQELLLQAKQLEFQGSFTESYKRQLKNLLANLAKNCSGKQRSKEFLALIDEAEQMIKNNNFDPFNDQAYLKASLAVKELKNNPNQSLSNAEIVYEAYAHASMKKNQRSHAECDFSFSYKATSLDIQKRIRKMLKVQPLSLPEDEFNSYAQHLQYAFDYFKEVNDTHLIPLRERQLKFYLYVNQLMQFLLTSESVTKNESTINKFLFLVDLVCSLFPEELVLKNIFHSIKESLSLVQGLGWSLYIETMLKPIALSLQQTLDELNGEVALLKKPYFH